MSEKESRYQENQRLIENTAGIEALNEPRERLALNNDSLLRAEAAEYVYKVDEFNRGHISKLPAAPEGIDVIDPSTIPGLENAVFTDKETGFGAALMKSSISGETMLVFRGTNNGVTGKKDWATNGKQGIGKETKQYSQAMKLADDVLEYVGEETIIVGHSLGGGLASAAVAVTGLQGQTYNAAGLHPNTAERLGGLSNEDASKLIVSQHVDGEVLTGVQKHGDTAVSGAAGGLGFLLGGPIGAVLGIGIQKLTTDDVPQAVGQMRELPSVEGGNPITRHGMGQVIDGIEYQIAQDSEQLKQYIRDYNE
ncbi:Mbeg1-like protein [Thalassotalea euphylliae]|uniref:Mbeg1-like protein n=1 Tax=Thalassotalea euphylliae TaxID=1655234 RepID=UPI001C6F4EC8|nr:Mbeg1-like protein [Thalassotalea euphylliae]